MINHELDKNEILVDFISSSSHSETDSHINKSTQLESLFGDSDHEIYSSSFLINIENGASNIMQDPFANFNYNISSKDNFYESNAILKPTKCSNIVKFANSSCLNAQKSLKSKITPSSNTKQDLFADLVSFKLSPNDGKDTNNKEQSSVNTKKNMKPNPLSSENQQKNQQSTFKQPKPKYASPINNENLPPKTHKYPSREAMFEDILDKSGFSKKQQTDNKKTLEDLKIEKDITNGKIEIDPERAKVLKWSHGKKNNIRALLCSMHKVILINLC